MWEKIINIKKFCGRLWDICWIYRTLKDFKTNSYWDDSFHTRNFVHSTHRRFDELIIISIFIPKQQKKQTYIRKIHHNFTETTRNRLIIHSMLMKMTSGACFIFYMGSHCFCFMNVIPKKYEKKHKKYVN